MPAELQPRLQELMPRRMIRHVNEIDCLRIGGPLRDGRITGLENHRCGDHLVGLQPFLERGQELAVGEPFAIHELRKVGGHLRTFQGKRGYSISVLRLVACGNACIRNRHPACYSLHESTLFDSQLWIFWSCHPHTTTRLPADEGEKARRSIRERLLRY